MSSQRKLIFFVYLFFFLQLRGSLPCFSAPAEGPIWLIVDSGRVYLQTGKDSWDPCPRSMRLYTGDNLLVSEDAVAVVAFPGGAEYRLPPGAHVRIEIEGISQMVKGTRILTRYENGLYMSEVMGVSKKEIEKENLRLSNFPYEQALFDEKTKTANELKNKKAEELRTRLEDAASASVRHMRQAAKTGNGDEYSIPDRGTPWVPETGNLKPAEKPVHGKERRDFQRKWELATVSMKKEAELLERELVTGGGKIISLRNQIEAMTKDGLNTEAKEAELLKAEQDLRITAERYTRTRVRARIFEDTAYRIYSDSKIEEDFFYGP